MFCVKCGANLASGNQYCGSCGHSVTAPASLDEKQDGLPSSFAETTPPASNYLTEEWKHFIGEKNQNYYLAEFTNIHAEHGKSSGSWHWPAAMFGWVWLIYRKMYALAFGWAVATLLLSSMWVLAIDVTSLMQAGTLGKAFTKSIIHAVFLLPIFAVPGWRANRWYFNFAQRRIEAIRVCTADRALQLQQIEQAGGTAAAPVIAFMALPVIGVIVAVAVPNTAPRNEASASTEPAAAARQDATSSAASPWLTKDQFYDELDKAMPWWESQNTDPKFLTWLDKVDPQTGVIRRTRFNQAYENYDVDTIVKIFTEYRELSSRRTVQKR